MALVFAFGSGSHTLVGAWQYWAHRGYTAPLPASMGVEAVHSSGAWITTSQESGLIVVPSKGLAILVMAG